MVDKRSEIKPVNLNTNFEESQKRLSELKKGRLETDIPLGDEYWKALNKHRAAFGSK